MFDLQMHTGIKRPSLEFFTTGETLSSKDKIGFACATTHASKNTYVTNDAATGFLLDFTYATSAWGATVTRADPDVLSNLGKDVAGNLKFKFDPPIAGGVPKGATIAFWSTAFGSQTMCGFTSSNLTKECTNPSGSLIHCVNPTAAATSFTICCYGVTIGDTQIVPSSVHIRLASDVSTFGLTIPGIFEPNNALTGYGYTATSPTVINYVEASPAKFATITAMSYGSVQTQVGAIGKLTLQITLPREIVRDARVTLTADFAPLFSTTAGQLAFPRCMATFATSGYYGSQGGKMEMHLLTLVHSKMGLLQLL
jgi:hypothetical protein